MSNNKTTNSYVIGFVLSLLLTFTAYFAVVNQMLGGWMLIAAILGLAFIQLWVQLIFFLHLWQESKPRWNLIIFLSTVFIILILVVGSLWIMNHLNYQMESPTEVNNYIIKDEGIQN